MDHYSPAEAARLSTTALEGLVTRLAHELDGDRWVPPRSTGVHPRLHPAAPERP